jgi:predicted PurR-regulated permease PerM
MSKEQTSGPVVWVATIAATCLTIYLFQGILWLVVPLLLAIILYYIIEPVVERLTHIGWSRESAAGIVMGLLAILTLAFAVVSMPKLVRKMGTWNHTIEVYIDNGTRLIDRSLNTIEKYAPIVRSFVPSREQGGNRSWDERFSEWAVANSSETLVQLFHWVPSLLLVPYLTYFILVDGNVFKRFIVQSIPNAYFEKSLLLFHQIDDQVRRYFQGLMMLAVLDSICLGVGLKLMGISGAFLLAVIIAVLSWIPYVGSVIGCLLVLVVAATDYASQTWMAYAAVALFLGVRLLDDFVFMPLTVGRSLHIHPVVTVLMIFVGGAVAGISGLFLVLPVLGVMMVMGQLLGQLCTNQRLRARHEHAGALARQRAQKGLTL